MSYICITKASENFRLSEERIRVSVNTLVFRDLYFDNKRWLDLNRSSGQMQRSCEPCGRSGRSGAALKWKELCEDNQDINWPITLLKNRAKPIRIKLHLYPKCRLFSVHFRQRRKRIRISLDYHFITLSRLRQKAYTACKWSQALLTRLGQR